MNEQNVLSQLQLTRELCMARQAQLVAIDRAVARISCQSTCKEIRIMASVAIFTAQLATKAETLIASEIRAGFAALDRMKQLPDSAQWEYRIAHTLGIAEGLNQAGLIQSRIIEQAQSALHKVAFLLMVQNAVTDLPVNKKSRQNYVLKILEEVSSKQGQRIVSSNDLARQMSAAFLRRAKAALDSVELTITSTCVASMEVTLGEICTALCSLAGESVRNNAEPVVSYIGGAVIVDEHCTARLIASGIVSASVSSLLKETAPWLTINLN